MRPAHQSRDARRVALRAHALLANTCLDQTHGQRWRSECRVARGLPAAAMNDETIEQTDQGRISTGTSMLIPRNARFEAAAREQK